MNSYIGPFTSIAADCEVVDSELDHSVVLAGSKILGIDKLTDSLVPSGKVTAVNSSARMTCVVPPNCSAHQPPSFAGSPQSNVTIFYV